MNQESSEVTVQDNSADYYVNKRYRGFGRLYHTAIIEEMMEGVRGKILDVGCGTGFISLLYPELDITGIDVSSGMLQHHKGKWLLAGAEKIPFKDNTFDAVVCRSVLHHLKDVNIGLKEIKRVLKPGGKFVCWETNKSWLAELVRKGTQHGDRFSEYHHSFNDLPRTIGSYFSPGTIRVKYQGFLAYPLLGFPDIADFSSIFGFAFNFLMKLDDFISKVQILNRLAFAVRIEAGK